MTSIETLVLKFKKYSVKQLTKRAEGGKCSADDLTAIAEILTSRNKEGIKFMSDGKGIVVDSGEAKKEPVKKAVSLKSIKSAFTKAIKDFLSKGDKVKCEGTIDHFSEEYADSGINFDELYVEISGKFNAKKTTPKNSKKKDCKISAKKPVEKKEAKKEEPKKSGEPTSVNLEESKVVEGLKIGDLIKVDVKGSTIDVEVKRIYEYAKANMKEYVILKPAKGSNICKSSASLIKGKKTKKDKTSKKAEKKVISTEKLESPKSYLEIYEIEDKDSVLSRLEVTGKSDKMTNSIKNRLYKNIDRKLCEVRLNVSDYELECIKINPSK